MRKLSLVLVTASLFLSAALFSDSPHGKDFKISCDACHSSKGWKLDKSIYSFDHNKTALPLAGQHQTLDCKQCHPTLVFSEAKTGCVDCHTDLHNQTVGPDCARCHTAKSWIVENITAMHRRSRFPLAGAHYRADCSACHPSASLLRFEPNGVECIDCHRKDFNATTSPNHIQANYSTNCLECHSINSITWGGTNINHSFFPLTLGHAVSDCYLCHTTHTFTAISTDCVSCHLTNYNSSTNPPHKTANFQTTCTDCHTTNPGWKPALFTIHNTYYPLTGAHLTTDCNNCHNNNYAIILPTICVGCHQSNFDHSTNPPHTSLNIPNTCADCHTTNPGWKPATFAIHNNYWPLTGGHLTADCNSCHNNNYTNTLLTTCVSCHQANYNQTTNPPHVSLTIPTTCGDCHTTNPGWKPATFAIHNNYWPLTGTHLTTDCNSCHNNNYTNTLSTACVSCHQTNYNQTTNPNHATISIPTTCADCHTTDPGWSPATFPIHSNYYVLAGAHLTIACSACHGTNYNNTLPTTCVGCHLNDYNQTNNPPHASGQYPTDCTMCHTQTAWSPSTFNHDAQYFPIYSGHHNGTWTSCGDCHTNSSNYQVFSCLTCHAHNQTDMDNSHSGIAGYSYNSNACYNCHPTGSAGGKKIKSNKVIKQQF